MKTKLKRFLTAHNQIGAFEQMSHIEKDIVEDVFNWQNKQLEGLKELFLESDTNMSIIPIARAQHAELREQVMNGDLKEGSSMFCYWECVNGFFETFNRRIKKFL